MEIFTFLNYANEESDDLMNSSTRVKNTESRISPEILEQCSSNLAPEMYIAKETMTPTMLLPWQHSKLQSLSVKIQISPLEGLAQNTQGPHIVLILSIRSLGVNDPC